VFGSCGDKGFHITFANGWTGSVQYGPGNYSDNHHGDFSESGPWSSEKAETAAFKGDIWLGPDDKPLTTGRTDVRGWQSAAQVLALMDCVAQLEEG